MSPLQDIYELLAMRSTPKEMAELLRGLLAEQDRYRRAFFAAKAFIDAHVADPDITEEMRAAYAEYQEASQGL